jgi:hypothetical protein
MTKNLNLLALMPCSVKIPLEEIIHNKTREIGAADGDTPQIKIVSNAVAQENVYAILSRARTLDDLPDIMIAPGISKFFYPDFVERFISKGCFKANVSDVIAPEFLELGVADPLGYYGILAFNPLVFLVDKTRDKDMVTPRRFEDLLDPMYKRRVAFRGHDGKSFCESILLTYYKCFGEESLKTLGGSVKCRLHPSEMVKLAGSGKDNAPDVSVLPLSFAKFVKKNENVEIVWPEQGAIVNPLVMLTKAETSVTVREIDRILSGEEIGAIFRSAGFYSVCKGAPDTLPTGKGYYWIGWDFLRSNDLGMLVSRLNDVMCAAAGDANK